MRVLAAMLEEKEEEVWAGQHFIPCQHNHDQGGILWQRAYDTHDIIMDHKHPWERVCHTVQGVPVKKWEFLLSGLLNWYILLKSSRGCFK